MREYTKFVKIHFILTTFMLGLACSSFAKSPAPTHTDVAYDRHEQTVLDFWQAKGEGARPLLIYIHGGGWEKGDKRAMRNADAYLDEGISVAAINYRHTPANPLPAPVHDAARAVQFLRSKANEWNIDKNKVVLAGGSAGGCTSLWIACHDDLANPNANDPIERESTRVQGAGVVSAQTSIDPKVIEPWIGPKVFLSMIYRAVGEKSIEDALKNYAQHEAVYTEFSPINHLTRDDPPLFLEYDDRPEFMALPATSFNYGIHHGMFGIKFKEKSAAVGHNEVELYIKGHDETEAYADADDFIIKTLLGETVVPATPTAEDSVATLKPSTVIPVPSSLKKFMPSRHNAKLEEAKNKQVDLVMIGDSITHNWESMANYSSTFEGRNVLNLGFAGDRTQNVLWRLQNGALDGISPRVVTLMVGTNHMHPPKKGYTPDSPEDIFTGIKAVVAEIRTRVPDAKLIVLSVFPRGSDEAQQRVEAVNAMLLQLADQRHVFHVDLNHAFLDENGEVNHALYGRDQLHLNSQGYEAWANALLPVLDDANLMAGGTNAGNKVKKVACIGDSITYGHGIEDRNVNSYPARLGAILGPDYTVENFGRSGATLLKNGNNPYWKHPHFKAAQAFNPDIVVIKLGTNDSKPVNWKHRDEFVSDYVDMVNTFQALPSKPTVYVCYPAPIFRSKGDFLDRFILEGVIPLVDQVALQTDATIIDLYQPLAGQPELFRDGVHPNIAGANVIAATVALAISDSSWPGTKSSFHGFDQYDFKNGDVDCKVVVPGKVADGKPWVWRARFWGHEPQFDIAMLNRGYHVVYCNVEGLFGNAEAVQRWNKFYDYLRSEHRFAERAVLEGMSRGGLIIYNWAAANPDKVAAIYGDAPVMDFKSWPGINRKIMASYGFKDRQEAEAYAFNPVDNLEPLVNAGIPIIHVVGDADDVVPVAENTATAEARYKKFGGVFKVIHKKDVGHHPHSLPDPEPIVDFVTQHERQPTVGL